MNVTPDQFQRNDLLFVMQRNRWSRWRESDSTKVTYGKWQICIQREWMTVHIWLQDVKIISAEQVFFSKSQVHNPKDMEFSSQTFPKDFNLMAWRIWSSDERDIRLIFQSSGKWKWKELGSTSTWSCGLNLSLNFTRTARRRSFHQFTLMSSDISPSHPTINYELVGALSLVNGENWLDFRLSTGTTEASRRRKLLRKVNKFVTH